MTRVQATPAAGGSKGRRTRDQLVDVAARLFAEKGYQATTFTDLIAAAGLSRGAFYFHFPSKQHLAAAVLQETKQRGLAALNQQLADAPDAGAALRRLGSALLEVQESDPAVRTASAISRELQASPELRELAAAATQEWISMITALVRRAQAEGSVRPDLDAPAVSRLMFAAVEGFGAQADSLDDPGRRQAAFARHVTLLADLLENGLFTGRAGAG